MGSFSFDWSPLSVGSAADYRGSWTAELAGSVEASRRGDLGPKRAVLRTKSDKIDKNRRGFCDRFVDYKRVKLENVPSECKKSL